MKSVFTRKQIELLKKYGFEIQKDFAKVVLDNKVVITVVGTSTEWQPFIVQVKDKEENIHVTYNADDIEEGLKEAVQTFKDKLRKISDGMEVIARFEEKLQEEQN